jgi:hypothetical protein
MIINNLNIINSVGKANFRPINIVIYAAESAIIAEYSVPLPERTHGAAPQGNL